MADSSRWLGRACVAALSVAMAATLGVTAGCQEPKTRAGSPTLDARDRVGPKVYPVLEGTVSQVAVLGTSAPLRVQAWGIVAELPGTGSREMPPNVRAILTDELYKRRVGSYIEGTENIRPELLLSTDKIAVVEVHGAIPPMAPKGTYFDLSLVALPGTQTTSLEHGLLWTTDLKIIGLSESDTSMKTLAIGRGPVYMERVGQTVELASGPTTAPATAPATQPGDKLNTRRGRVIGGGMVIDDMPVTLQLYVPSYRITSQIQRIVNARFPGRPPYASALNDTTVTLRIPPAYHANPQEFVDLVMHMYLGQEAPGFVDRKAGEILRALAEPDAPHRQLGLALQAMGRTIIDEHLRPSYTSENPTVRYYAARAGALMQDVQGMIVLEAIAHDGKDPYRFEAIASIGALGRAGETERATVSLGRLLADKETKVRLAAYEALRATGSPAVKSYWVPRKFQMDIVPCDAPTVIYVAQGQRPRIAILGRNMTLSPGMLYTSRDYMLTVNVPEYDAQANAGAAPGAVADDSAKGITIRTGEPPLKDTVTVFYRGAADEKAVTLKAPPYLPVLIARMAYTPDPRAEDYDPYRPYAGVSYQRVVEMLEGLVRQKAVAAEFVLEPAPPMQTTLTDLAESARPDGPVITPRDMPKPPAKK